MLENVHFDLALDFPPVVCKHDWIFCVKTIIAMHIVAAT